MLEASDASFPSNITSHSTLALLKVFFVIVGLLRVAFVIARIFFAMASRARVCVRQ